MNVSDARALLEQLEEEGFGEAEVFVDTDTTLGFAAVTEINPYDEKQVVIR